MDSILTNHLNTITIAIFFVITTLIYVLFFHSFKVGNHHHKHKEPPMVDGSWPILGHLPLLRGSTSSQPLHKALGAIADKYGPLFTIKLGSRKMVVLSNSEIAKECFTKNDSFVTEFLNVMEEFTIGDAIPSLRWLDLGGREKAMKEVANELDKIMNEWLDEHKKKINDDENNGKEEDFIDVMLSILSNGKIDAFDSDSINKATALNIIVGAIDTTSVTLTWAMCLLLKNPIVLEKAKEEFDKKIGKERCINDSDINKLAYIHAIIKETLRLYPPAPLPIREFNENTNLGGYDIEKGTILLTNVWKINTDPNVWSDYLEFKPEKFLTTHKDIDFRGHHFDLLPFGSGRRMCPGISFGVQIVHFILASFLHSFEILIDPSSMEPVDMTGTLGAVYAKATPLMVMIKPRLSPNCYEIM